MDTALVRIGKIPAVAETGDVLASRVVRKTGSRFAGGVYTWGWEIGYEAATKFGSDAVAAGLKEGAKVMIYRPRRARRIIAAWNCFNALIVSLVLVLVLPIEAGVGVALTVPVLAATWFWSQRVCLEVRDNGVVIRNFWRTVEIPWRDVTAIEARRLFGSSRVDLCLWFDRRDGKPVPASATQSPGPDGQALIDALTRARKGARLPFSAPTDTRSYRKGSDSWQVQGLTQRAPS